MPRITPHGGQCCGMRHLHGFSGNETVDDIRAQMASVHQGRVKGCRTIEVVLTNYQLRRAKRNFRNDLVANLYECGFKFSYSFNNANSGNVCNVFHYVKFPSKKPVGLASLERKLAKEKAEAEKAALEETLIEKVIL